MKKPNIKQFKRIAQECNGIITAMAERMGVYRSTIYDWMDADDEFKRVIDNYRGVFMEKCRKSSELLALGIPIIDEHGRFAGWKERPDGQMARFFLGVYGKREGFGEERITLTHNIDFDKLSDNQIIMLAKQMAREVKIPNE